MRPRELVMCTRDGGTPATCTSSEAAPRLAEPAPWNRNVCSRTAQGGRGAVVPSGDSREYAAAKAGRLAGGARARSAARGRGDAAARGRGVRCATRSVASGDRRRIAPMSAATATAAVPWMSSLYVRYVSRYCARRGKLLSLIHISEPTRRS
eukprot:3742423-Prymnesium_polylepis.1